MPTWLPGAGPKRHALRARDAVFLSVSMMYEGLKTSRVREYTLPSLLLTIRRNPQARGTATPCFVSQMLDEYEERDVVDLDHEEDMKCMSNAIYGGKWSGTHQRKITWN